MVCSSKSKSEAVVRRASSVAQSSIPDATPPPTSHTASYNRAPASFPSLAISRRKETPKWQYRNSLLAAVGYLDLANAMDFPANVWNSNPLPTFAIVLMALGGSIAIVSSSIAVIDLLRSRRNVVLLHEERAYFKSRFEAVQLHQEKEDNPGEGLLPLEQAWYDMTFREIGWEYIDRILLDICMGVAGVLVGIGCILAIRGSNPDIFLTSNIMSGYLGNGFVAFYTLVNLPWSVFMWYRGHRHHLALLQGHASLDARVQQRLQLHLFRHKLYALTNGITALIGGAGSMVSSTLWPGYVVLIPSIAGSIFCNLYWRRCLGYNRYSIRDRKDLEEFDILERLRAVIAIRAALADSDAAKFDLTSIITEHCTSADQAQREIMRFLHDYHLISDPESCLHDSGEQQDLEAGRSGNESQVQLVERSCASSREESIHSPLDNLRRMANAAIYAAGPAPFGDEERFLLELYGYYLAVKSDQQAKKHIDHGEDDMEMQEETKPRNSQPD